MPEASPESPGASWWGSSKVGTSSRWHHERAPYLSQFLNPPLSPPSQWIDNQPPIHAWRITSSTSMFTYTRKYQLAYSVSFYGTTNSLMTLSLWHAIKRPKGCYGTWASGPLCECAA